MARTSSVRSTRCLATSAATLINSFASACPTPDSSANKYSTSIACRARPGTSIRGFSAVPASAACKCLSSIEWSGSGTASTDGCPGRRPRLLPLRESPEMSPAPASNKQAEFTDRRRVYWDRVADSLDREPAIRKYYRRRLREIYRFLIPPGMRVLELGCGQGDLLSSLQPSHGVGIDLSARMVERAQSRHPECTFFQADAHRFDLNEQFDYIICSDLVNDVWDVQGILQQASRHSHSSTRLIINTYSRAWEVPRRAAEAMGIARTLLPQNWLTGADMGNLLY